MLGEKNLPTHLRRKLSLDILMVYVILVSSEVMIWQCPTDEIAG